jgi:N,N-dimethylformamidase
MVSTGAPSFRARLVRLAGEGGATEIASDIDGTYPGGLQTLDRGSHVTVDSAPPLQPGGDFAIEVRVYPTLLDGRVQALAGQHDGRHGYLLVINEAGCASLMLDDQTIAIDEPLQTRTWYRIRGSYDAGVARIEREPLGAWPVAAGETRDESMPARPWTAASVPFRLAATGAPPASHFNGKLEAPSVFAADGSVISAWDLGGDHASDHVADSSGEGRNGRCVNAPMRAVTGHRWRGGTTDPALAPDDFRAIHFHDDDLEDARWEPSFSLRFPPEMTSGAYAVRVDTATGSDELPFIVRPSKGAAGANVAVVLPTLSYLAYANEHNSWSNPIPATPGLEQILAAVGDRDRYAAEHELNSLYELHSDGSGVSYSSRLRPILNFRSDYAMPLLLGGPHQFSADLQLLTWLDAKKVRYDLLTDEDVDSEGSDLLASYAVLLTGSHPEYWTERMLDGLENWLAEGGRLMYLGGNGFYWVSSTFPEKPHLLEVRRGFAGSGTWRSAPGEAHHASTGEQGGLWRFRGRTPQRLSGVGFTAQGFDSSRPYTRTESSREPHRAWIFEGVESDVVGDHGDVLGGAAGFEIDRFDVGQGSPANATVLATSRGFSDVYQAASEDILTSDSKQGGTVSPLVRADMVFFDGPNGSAVFSVGSIAWCGALLGNNCVNDVSRITENVLRRFSQTEPGGST